MFHIEEICDTNVITSTGDKTMPMKMPLSWIIEYVQSHPGPKVGLVEWDLFWLKDFAEIVKALNENPRVTELDLTRNTLMCDPKNNTCRELSKLNNIEKLYISQCDVNDDALKELLQEGTLRDHLIELSITDNPHVTDQSEELFKKLPNIKSLWLIDSGMTQETIDRLLDQIEPEPEPYSLPEGYEKFSVWESSPPRLSTPPPSLLEGVPGFEEYIGFRTWKKSVTCP
jgi:hypothetical protein